MWKQIQAFALATALAGSGAATAAEMPQKSQNPSGLPKGSYSTSCTCQLSGGVTLMCFCNNLQAKMFETTLDLRNCHAPKDIKNCDGTLTCTESAAAQCPGK
jgi:hypothetical protein